jgi:TP901 family phage tail tape measure protein
MASRSIELVLKAEVGRFVAGLKTARDAVNATSRDVAGFVRNNEQDMQTFGTALTTAGAGLTAMTVGAVKAAIDWETAWAGVQKTNDGTAEQMQALEEDLRNLATTLPATHEEIAATAEMAGQLGVAVDDVAVFTETMVHLGETTNLSAEEAATALARFSNITGTSFSDVDRLGSALVGLGNNFATTESEILHMSERIAAAGTQAGLSEGEIMGLATAMSSVGIEAEAGGTAMTMTFNNIDKAVREGGDALDGWAELAGTTASDFANIWREEPAQAVDMVVQGLAKVDAEGGSVAGTLEELGVNGIRQADVLRRLASAGEIAGDAMAMGNEEFEKNSALTEEASLRYETAAAQIQVAWNSIVDAAITAGSALAPIVGDIAEGIGDLAGWFAQLPEPVMGTVTALSGLGGVAALGAGGLVLLAPRAVETYDAFRRLNESSKTLPTNLKNVGKAAGPALGVLAGFTVLNSLADNFSTAAAGASEFENEMRLLADGAREGREGLDELASSTQIDFTGHVTQIESLDEAAEHAAMNGFLKFIDSAENLWGLMGTPMHKQAEESFNAIDEAASSLVNGGNLEAAAAGFEEAAEALSNQGLEYDEILAMFPEYTAALQTMAAEQGYALEGTELYEAALGNLPPELQEVAEATDDAAQQDELVGALEEVGIAADGTVESLSEYLDMLFQTGLAEQSAMQAQATYQESLDGVTAAVEQIKSEHGGLSDVLNDSKDGFDVTTEAGRIAQAAFLDVASSGQDMASAMAEAGESQEDIQASLEGTYDDLIATAGEFGITGSAAEDLARKVLGVPDGVDIETWMDETAQEKANELGASLDEIPPGLDIITSMDDSARAKAFETGEAVDAITGYKKVDVAISEDGTAGQVQSKVDSITGKTEYVFVTDDGTTTTVQQRIVNIDGVNRTVYVDDNGTVYATQSEINGITDGSSFINVTDNASSANSRINNAARNRTAIIRLRTIGGGPSAPGNYGVPYAPGKGPGGYTGGRAGRDFGFNKLPHLANGGRLPYTGLGTDQILGVSSLGHPVAMLDDLEWVVNRRSSDKYDSVIDRINRDHPSVHHLANLRDGGRAGQLASTILPPSSVAAQQIDYDRLAAVLGDRRLVTFQPHFHNADATVHDAFDTFQRYDLAESRR